jgi:hypothetical protein
VVSERGREEREGTRLGRFGRAEQGWPSSVDPVHFISFFIIPFLFFFF